MVDMICTLTGGKAGCKAMTSEHALASFGLMHVDNNDEEKVALFGVM